MDTTLMSEYVELHKKIIEKLYRYVEYHYFDANDAPQLLSKNDAVIAGNLYGGVRFLIFCRCCSDKNKI